MAGTKVAHTTWRLAMFLALLAGAGLVLSHLSALPPRQGFGLVMLAMTGALIVLPISIVSWIRARDREEGASTPAKKAAALTGVMVASVLISTTGAGSAPRINDITTDLDNPPVYRALAQQPDNAARDMTYPKSFAAVQKSAYPKVGPKTLAVSPQVALDRATAAAEGLGLHVVRVYEDGFEATATSFMFRFVDDVVVRVTPVGEEVRIDVRSKSRVGQGDMGKNAERIEALLAHI